MSKVVAVLALLTIAFSLDVGESDARAYNKTNIHLKERKLSAGDNRQITFVEVLFSKF